MRLILSGVGQPALSLVKQDTRSLLHDEQPDIPAALWWV